MSKAVKNRIVLSISKMKEEDIEAVQSLEKICFNKTWPLDQFKKEISNKKVARYIVVKHQGKLIGYGGSWIIMDEIHITSMAVDPLYRGMKIGKLIMWGLFQEGLEKGCRWATLEVSVSNKPALKIYEDFGFKIIGRRKDYYDVREDAYVMWLKDVDKPSFKDKMNQIRKEWEEKICLLWE